MRETAGDSPVISGLRPPWKPGQSGNPTGAGAGRPSKQAALAKQIAKEAGLEFLNELASQHRKRGPEIAKSLVDAACTTGGKSQVAAIALLARLTGLIEDKAETVTIDEMRRAFEVVWEVCAEEVGYEKAQRIADAWADRVSGIKGGRLSLFAEPQQ